MKKNIITATLAAATVMASTAHAQNFQVGRGPNVDRMASNCNIGPFPQVGKAGYYNSLCDTMPDSEKCLALIKLQMNNEGVIRPDQYNVERNQYCLQVLTKELVGE